MVISDSPENAAVLEKRLSSLHIISESLISENISPSLPPVKSRWSFSSSIRSYGSSRDETFYESNPWLPSDSEDDFYSVNGDFTPSRGQTPKCSFSEKPPRFHNPLYEDERPRVSFSLPPAPRRKKLAELFRDSIREEREEKLLQESSESTQSEMSKKSSCDELKTTEDSIKDKKNLKSLNYHHRCLPRFPSFRGSLMEKGKKKKKKIHVK